MRRHGPFADAQPGRDLPGRESLGRDRQDLALATREAHVEVAAELDAVGDLADRSRDRTLQDHLTVGDLQDRAEEIDRIDVLVDVSIRAHEECAADHRRISVGSHREHGMGREPFPDRPDQPRGVVLSFQPESHQYDDA